jgi:hypothetical protein
VLCPDIAHIISFATLGPRMTSIAVFSWQFERLKLAEQMRITTAMGFTTFSTLSNGRLDSLSNGRLDSLEVCYASRCAQCHKPAKDYATHRFAAAGRVSKPDRA